MSKFNISGLYNAAKQEFRLGCPERRISESITFKHNNICLYTDYHCDEVTNISQHKITSTSVTSLASKNFMSLSYKIAMDHTSSHGSYKN